MSLGSVTAKNTVLDAMLGANKAAGAPATLYLALFYGDPLLSGSELTSTGGYLRTAIVNNGTNFGAGSGGQKINAITWTTGSSTGAWSNPATYWGFYDDPTAGNLYHTGQLVDAVGTPTSYTITRANQALQFPVGALVVTAT